MLQGSVLAIAGLISKAIGFIYRIPMANIMGNEGNGLYSVAFGIYNIALTLSSYSMPLAVSKLMSSRLSEGRNKDAHRIFSISFIFALIMGSLAWAGLLFGANFFAELYQKPGLQYPLFILAPTTFIVALLGTCRGYFQGHRNMVPTAVSQVLEQIVNAIVSVLAASLFVKMAEDTTRDFDVSRGAAGAAGGTMGTLAGATVALFMFILLIVVNLRKIRAERNSGEASNEDTAVLWKALFLTVFPVIMSQTVYQLGYTIDDLIFGNIMVRVRGISERETTILQGIFNTQYNQMINLPAAIAVAFSSAVLPSIVGAYTKGEIAEVRKKMDTVFRFNLPFGIRAFYPGSSDHGCAFSCTWRVSRHRGHIALYRFVSRYLLYTIDALCLHAAGHGSYVGAGKAFSDISCGTCADTYVASALYTA